MTGQELEIIDVPSTPALPTELTLDQLAARQDKIQQAMRERMKPGVHFGRTPGAKKPTLLKPGAETLCSLFMFDPEYEGETHMDEDGHLHVLSKCILFSIPTGNRVASGRGYCSTAERRYAFYKNGDPVPPAKRPELFNTIVKMADKRALVAATLNATAASDVFTQDVEDTAAVDVPQQGAEPQADGKRTAAQNRNLNRILGELKKSGTPPPEPHEDWKSYSREWTQRQFGKTSSADLTVEECGKLIDHLDVPFG